MQEGIPQGGGQDKKEDKQAAREEAGERKGPLPLTITKEALEKIFQTEGPQVKELMLTRYEMQELARAEATDSPEEIFDIYLETARTLAELGPIARARKHLEELANFAYELGDKDRLKEVEDALDALPSVH